MHKVLKFDIFEKDGIRPAIVGIEDKIKTLDDCPFVTTLGPG